MADLLPLRQAPVEHAAEHARAHAHVAAEHEVVEHGQAAEQRDVLERARHAERGDRARALAGDVAALERDAAGVGLVEAGDHVEQRGLARAVRADDGEDAAPWERRPTRRRPRPTPPKRLDAPSTDICTAAAAMLIGTLGKFMRAALAIGAAALMPTTAMSSRPARMDEPSQVPTAWPCNG